MLASLLLAIILPSNHGVGSGSRDPPDRGDDGVISRASEDHPPAHAQSVITERYLRLPN